MNSEQARLVERLHAALVEEIRVRRPEYLRQPFTVAEIYQELVPYRNYRDQIGAAMNGDYEDALMRLLCGTGGYLVLESEPARKRLLEELQSSNPNTGIFREYAALDVRLNQARLPTDAASDAGNGAPEAAAAPPSAAPEREAASPSPAPAPFLSPSSHAPAPSRLEQQMQNPSPQRTEAVSAGARSSEEGVARTPARSAAQAGGASAAAGKAAAELTNCRWCREELPRREKLRFCPFCGMDVNLVPCRSCGEELEPEWRFCVACGTQVTTEE
jgi:hypothetical protein